MDQFVESMEIDDNDFDNKENAGHRNNLLSRAAFTEKGYEDFDASELSMRLRYSLTPESSPMSKSHTVNYADKSKNSDYLSNSNNSLTEPVITKSVISESTAVPKEQSKHSGIFKPVLRPQGIELLAPSFTNDCNNIAYDSVIGTNEIDDNVSLPSIDSSSSVTTPEATTPTKESSKLSVESPLLRGLKSVLNMFRSSQSPIPLLENKKEEISSSSTPNIECSLASSSRGTNQDNILISTPVNKKSGVHKDSIVFNEDLEKELQWKDETIIFSKEKIPINKLMLQHTMPITDILNKEFTKNKNEFDSSDNLDFSYNNNAITDTTFAEGKDENKNIESDCEFLDCDNTLVNISVDINQSSQLSTTNTKSNETYCDFDNIHNSIKSNQMTTQNTSLPLDSTTVSLKQKLNDSYTLCDQDNYFPQTENCHSIEKQENKKNKDLVKCVDQPMNDDSFVNNINLSSSTCDQEVLFTNKMKIDKYKFDSKIYYVEEVISNVPINADQISADSTFSGDYRDKVKIKENIVNIEPKFENTAINRFCDKQCTSDNELIMGNIISGNSLDSEINHIEVRTSDNIGVVTQTENSVEGNNDNNLLIIDSCIPDLSSQTINSIDTHTNFLLSCDTIEENNSDDTKFLLNAQNDSLKYVTELNTSIYNNENTIQCSENIATKDSNTFGDSDHVKETSENMILISNSHNSDTESKIITQTYLHTDLLSSHKPKDEINTNNSQNEHAQFNAVNLTKHDQNLESKVSDQNNTPEGLNVISDCENENSISQNIIVENMDIMHDHICLNSYLSSSNKIIIENNSDDTNQLQSMPNEQNYTSETSSQLTEGQNTIVEKIEEIIVDKDNTIENPSITMKMASIVNNDIFPNERLELYPQETIDRNKVNSVEEGLKKTEYVTENFHNMINNKSVQDFTASNTFEEKSEDMVYILDNKSKQILEKIDLSNSKQNEELNLGEKLLHINNIIEENNDKEHSNEIEKSVTKIEQDGNSYRNDLKKLQDENLNISVQELKSIEVSNEIPNDQHEYLEIEQILPCMETLERIIAQSKNASPCVLISSGIEKAENNTCEGKTECIVDTLDNESKEMYKNTDKSYSKNNEEINDRKEITSKTKELNLEVDKSEQMLGIKNITEEQNDMEYSNKIDRAIEKIEKQGKTYNNDEQVQDENVKSEEELKPIQVTTESQNIEQNIIIEQTPTYMEMFEGTITQSNNTSPDDLTASKINTAVSNLTLVSPLYQKSEDPISIKTSINIMSTSFISNTSGTEVQYNKQTNSNHANSYIQEGISHSTNRDSCNFSFKHNMNETNEPSSKFAERKLIKSSENSTPIVSSSEQSIYYSSGSVSNKTVESKNVFNLPEISDITLKFSSSGVENILPSNFQELEPMYHSECSSVKTYDTTLLPQKDDEETLSSACNNTIIQEIHTEDEDTVEGPFLETEELTSEGTLHHLCNNTDMMRFSDIVPQQTDEAGEMFIDAQTFDFLMNQNNDDIFDSGKESLFLKFDPLYTQQSKVQSSEDSHILQQETFDDLAVPSCSLSDRQNNDNLLDESNLELNLATNKPMMVVPPAINSVVLLKNKTPPRVNRYSSTFSSPAMAVIDRLLSLSANNSISHETNINHEQIEADLTLMQLKEVLSEKELHVQQLRYDNEELKDRLSTLESHMKTLEVEADERLKRVNELNEKLNEKTRLNKTMATVVAEYEKTISRLIADIEQNKKLHADERNRLINERDEQTTHLTSMEVSFSDLHSKYEKSKQIILSYKVNEDRYKKTVLDLEENFAKLQTNYDTLKQHATSKLNHANEELEKINKSHESEVLKMNAMLKRKELYITSLEESVAQKTKANEELTAICDDLLSKLT